MTKKKKTLRAALLASILAMAFSATAWGASTYNPNLKDEAGTGAGTVGEDQRYPYQHNYFIQYNEFFTDNHKEGEEDDPNIPDGTGSPERWDRVIGIFLKDDFKKESESQNIDTITIQGAQLYHVNYTVEEDGSIKIKNPDSDLPEGTEYETIDGGHYCGESAQSVSVGQLQRMNEVYYYNDVALQTAIVSEADKRADADIALDGRLDVIENEYIKNVTTDGDVITITKGDKNGDGGATTLTYTDKHITDFSQSISGYGKEKAGTITSTIVTNFGENIDRTVDISGYVSDAIENEAKNADVTYNGDTVTIQNAITNIDTAIDKGWNFQVEGNDKQNVQMGNTVTFDSIDANLTITNDEQTIKFDFSDKPIFTEVTIGSTTIQSNSEGNLTYSYKEDNTVINKTIATTDDGMRYGADNSEVELDLDLNDKLNIKGDNTNITTVAIDAIGNMPAQIQVRLNDDITVNSVTANSVYSNYVEAKVVNAEKVLSDYVQANRINAGVVDTDKVFSQYVETEIVNADKIFSEYGEIKLVNSETVSAKTLTLRGETSNTDVIFNDEADGNDGAKGRIEYKDSFGVSQQVANLNDGKTYYGDSGEVFVKLQDGINIIGGVTNVEQLSDNNIGVVAGANEDGIATLNVKLSKDITGLDSVTSTTVNSETINVSKVVNINNKTQITEKGININKKVIVEENKVDVGGNRIENVADGVNPTDAVNVRQLDKLGNRVDKVGAGAAALAALHPLDFDPDDKLSFSAGVGNYGGETASALGMFYRPTEKIMLSAAGTMGNGENMVNLGVTFALDRKNNVSNSRVAMAREIQDLREQVAALTALVTQLAGRNNPVLMDTVMFPDVPENHWAYDYIEGLQKRGIVEGYPDGNFGGDRSMTRYEYAAMLYRALEKGFPVDSRLLDEFDAELGRIRIDRIKGLDDDGNKIERVRVNQYEDRDDYGSKLTTVNEAE